MLLVNGEKMSKSLGNFLVLHDVLEKVRGEDVRFMLMRTHYRSTLDFTDSGLVEAGRELDRFYRAIEKHPGAVASEVPPIILEPLCDDLNTPGAIAGLHVLADRAMVGDAGAAAGLLAAGGVLGVFTEQRFERPDNAEINRLIKDRMTARKLKNFVEADRIRETLKELGVILEDGPDGKTSYRYFTYTNDHGQ
jgi:cysteinyl-tRNA synthetase